MASKSREARIIAAVPCPVCAAKIGERCTFTADERRRLFGLRSAAQPGLPVHGERRKAWQEARRDS